MKIIDARSGQEMVVGKTVAYPGGESLTLLKVKSGLLSARARVRSTTVDYTDPGRALVTRETWIDLAVRWTHPRFLLQHIAFIPT